MAASERASRPQAVLFACGQNAVRSPMAAAMFAQMFGRAVYVGSAGVQKGELDPFAVAVMEEIGIDMARHKPITFEELDELEGVLVHGHNVLPPRGQREGQFRRHDANLLAIAILFLCAVSPLKRWNLREYRPGDVAEQLMELIFRGIVNGWPPGSGLRHRGVPPAPTKGEAQ